MQKIMFRETEVNRHYSRLNLSRPSTLNEVKALKAKGYCVRDLDEDTMKDYLDCIEIESLQELIKMYGHQTWKEIDEWTQIQDIKEELKQYGSFLWSTMENIEPFIILRDDLEDCFEQHLSDWGREALQEAILLYEHKY